MKHSTSDHYVGGAAAFMCFNIQNERRTFLYAFQSVYKGCARMVFCFCLFSQSKKIYPKGFGGDRKAPENKNYSKVCQADLLRSA